jgi:hypothetical protein
MGLYDQVIDRFGHRRACAATKASPEPGVLARHVEVNIAVADMAERR